MAVCNHSQGIIIVELPPEPETRAELDNLIETIRSGPGCDIVIDFEKVDIMTSLTLSGFLKIRQAVIESGKRLIFVNVSAITRDIFNVTCFDGVFEFAADRNEAVAALTENECEQPAH